MKCSLCRESCPSAAIDEALTINAKCTECGICLANCPTEAIAGEGYRPQALQKAAQVTGPLLLNCQKINTGSDWPCLGFLDARLLAGLACREGEARAVWVDDSKCGGCNKAVKKYLAEAVGQANLLLAAAGKPPIRLGSCTGAEVNREKPVSRRTFFSQVFAATVETVRETVFPAAVGPEPLKRYEFFRRASSKELEHKECPGQKIFPSITMTAECYGCGLCAKACPNKAITFIEQGSEIQLRHNPLLCTQCKVCATLCPRQAIRFDWAGTLADQVAANVSLPQCEVCGRYFQPLGEGALCLECKLKGDNW